jgi:hypothetical protein
VNIATGEVALDHSGTFWRNSAAHGNLFRAAERRTDAMPNSEGDQSGWEFAAYVAMAIALFAFAVLNRLNATH